MEKKSPPKKQFVTQQFLYDGLNVLEIYRVGDVAPTTRQLAKGLRDAAAGLLAMDRHVAEMRYATDSDVRASAQRMIEKHRRSLQALGND